MEQENRNLARRELAVSNSLSRVGQELTSLRAPNAIMNDYRTANEYGSSIQKIMPSRDGYGDEHAVYSSKPSGA